MLAAAHVPGSATPPITARRQPIHALHRSGIGALRAAPESLLQAIPGR